MQWLPLEAPAKIVAEQARALAEELGPEAAKLAMGGSAQSVKNSARQYKGLVRRFNLSLPIRVSSHIFEENGAQVELPLLLPSSWLSYMMTAFAWVFLGGLEPGVTAAALLTLFWKEYKRFQPTHAVYEYDDERLSRTIPVALHGDAGRGQKKSPLEILSLEAVLGLNTATPHMSACRCCTPSMYGGGDVSDPASIHLNHKNNSYLSRFLLFAYASKDYEATPNLLKSMIAEVSCDLGRLAREGFQTPHGRYYIGAIGMKGDLEYLQKTGSLQRCYTRVGTVNFIQCCHLCEAGSRDLPHEDVSEQAGWVQETLKTLPWDAPPPFSLIPFEDWAGRNHARAAAFLRLDPFHCFRLGVARNFTASCLILLCYKGFFDAPMESQALDARLTRAYSYFQLFCLQEGEKPLAVRTFSRAKLHFEKAYNFPYITGKGSDSVLILKFLIFFLRLQLTQSVPSPHAGMLRLMVQAAEAGLFFTQSIHGHGLFLAPSCANNIKKSIQAFANNYVRLASRALQERLTLFSMVPKVHSMCHFREYLKASQQDPHGRVLNVGLWDCSANEDFVGKVARSARRISNRKLEDGVIRAYLVKTKFVLKRHKAKRAG